MRKLPWLLPALLVSAPSFAMTGEGDGTQRLGMIDRWIGGVEAPELSASPRDDKVLAQDSTSDYEIKFEYSNSAYGQAEIANYGEAFQDGVLVGTAAVTEVQEISANQARVRVEVTHLDADGQILYEGVVFYRKGLPGNVISETTISGSRDHRIFTTWPTW